MHNQNPEQKARDNIDLMLSQAGWVVQSKNKVNLSVALGVAVREYQTFRNREKEQLLKLEDWKLKRVWDCLSNSQKQFVLDNKKYFDSHFKNIWEN